MKSTTSSMPAIFLAHGAPVLFDDAGWVNELALWAGAMPRPRAVLMVSAHWEQSPVTIGATSTVPLLHDFCGFPARFYAVTYAAPGAPDLARRVSSLLPAPAASDPRRGLDHGAYVPLRCMYPEADVPVLQISLPSLDPAVIFAMGEALAPLREEGVLIAGSGFLTHNLGAIGSGPAPQWAREFDEWCARTIAGRDFDALIDYRRRGPGVRQALPTHEHFVPVLVAAGASARRAEAAAFPIDGFWYGSFTRRSVQFG